MLDWICADANVAEKKRHATISTLFRKCTFVFIGPEFSLERVGMFWMNSQLIGVAAASLQREFYGSAGVVGRSGSGFGVGRSAVGFGMPFQGVFFVGRLSRGGCPSLLWFSLSGWECACGASGWSRKLGRKLGTAKTFLREQVIDYSWRSRGFRGRSNDSCDF
jgi:hypothetical protein